MDFQPTPEDFSASHKPLPVETTVTSRSVAHLLWQMQWHSDGLRHTEELFTPLNIWRDLDLCPDFLARHLAGRQRGESLGHTFAPGELLPASESSNRRSFPLASFAKSQLAPQLGRFYPLGLLRDFPFALNLFRCTGLAATDLEADLNHPLAGRSLDLRVTVADILRKKGETGGQCQDWAALLTDGPGQQARWHSQPTDFFRPDAFQRQDDQPDARFYSQPRLVSHIDGQARQIISRLYGRLLRPGLRVLDLMSSWQSHLPTSLHLGEVAGLGLNEAELKQNPRLTSHLVHDLNQEPRLPFPEAAFDAVVCTVSVEYLTRPLEVFAEIRRVLKDRGLFVVTFSNRWFPPKVIKIWTELMDFERLGLTLEYFLRTGGFVDLETFSSRGWPRPEDDKYYPQVRLADPVFAAWGRKAG